MRVNRQSLLDAIVRTTKKFNARLHPEQQHRVILWGRHPLTILTHVHTVRAVQHVANLEPAASSATLPPVSFPGRRLAEALRGLEADEVTIAVSLAGAGQRAGMPVTVEFTCGRRRFALAGRTESPPELPEPVATSRTPLPQHMLLECLLSIRHALEHQSYLLSMRSAEGRRLLLKAMTHLSSAESGLFYLDGDPLAVSLSKNEVDVLLDFLLPDTEHPCVWRHVQMPTGLYWQVQLPQGELLFPSRAAADLPIAALGEELVVAHVTREWLDNAVQYVTRTHRTEQVDPYVTLSMHGKLCTVSHQAEGLTALEEVPAGVQKPGGVLVNANLLRRALGHSGYMPTLRVCSHHVTGTPVLEITNGMYRAVLPGQAA